MSVGTNPNAECVSLPGDPTIAIDTWQNLFESGKELSRAWMQLLNQEMVLARYSFFYLLIGIVILPVIALSAWLTVSALFVTLMQLMTGNWLSAMALTLAAELFVLAGFLRNMRRWWHNLGMPQSRAVLVGILRNST